MAPRGRKGRNNPKKRGGKGKGRESEALRELERVCPPNAVDWAGGKIHRLDFSDSSMAVLPESIGTFRWLRSLDLSFCVNLTVLPETIGELKALEVLVLTRCMSLGALPKRSASSRR